MDFFGWIFLLCMKDGLEKVRVNTEFRKVRPPGLGIAGSLNAGTLHLH